MLELAGGLRRTGRGAGAHAVDPDRGCTSHLGRLGTSSVTAPHPISARVNHTPEEFFLPRAGLVFRGRLCVLAVVVVLLAAAGSLFVAQSAGATVHGDHASTPIMTRQASDGSWLATVNVSVAGGPSVPVQLDTGSSGLVIDANVVGKGAHPTGQTYSSPYVSGTVYGKIETGAVSIGGVKSAASTAMSVVPATSPQGKAWASGPVHGILGIAMTNDQTPTTVYSPLLQLPGPYWQGVTVTVARGVNARGSLVMGPVHPKKLAVSLPMEPASPSTYPDGRPAYQKDTTMCWQIGKADNDCGLTDMDLGVHTPAVNTNYQPNIHNGQAFSPGQPVTITSPAGTPIWSFTTGSNVSVPNELVVAPLSTGYTEFNTSIGFFFAHSLAYDVTGHQFLVSANPLNR